MTRIRIIGTGSSAGDDQLGWRVVNELSRSGLLRDFPYEVSAYICDRPGPTLASYLEGADMAVLVDAMSVGAAPGTMYRFENETVTQARPSCACHGLRAALDLLKAPGGRAPMVVLYGIEIEQMAPASDLSEAVKAAVPLLAQRIADELYRRYGYAATPWGVMMMQTWH